LNTHHADPALIAQVCVGLVRSWAGGKDLDDMYRDLLRNAADSSSVDQIVYQLEGDPAYAENVALIVLSTAWNYPELQEEIQWLAEAAVESPRTVTSTELAQTVLYGMYLMARHGAEIKQVAYRTPQGAIETKTVEQDMAAATLFDAVRDQYGAAL
jgi:hypothetical protein